MPNAALHYNGRKTRDSERSHFKFVTLLDLANLNRNMLNFPQRGVV